LDKLFTYIVQRL